MKRFFIPFLMLGIAGCFAGNNDTKSSGDHQVVNVYSARHYDVDKKIMKQFEKETGIEINLLQDDADKLLAKLENEGSNSPCDLYITVDGAMLSKAKEKGLLQKTDSKELEEAIPDFLKDKDNYWFAQSVRARILVYSTERVSPDSLSTYEDLAHPKWKGKLLMRTSDNSYNQSLLSSIIVHNGAEEALAWAKGVVANMAREPKGNDRDQVKAIAAGEGDVALVNTYYVGRMTESEEAEEREAAKKVKVYYPNQNGRGAHINISGAGIAKHAKNKENALKLLLFLLREDIQQKIADENFEFPARKGVKTKDFLKDWGSFKVDTLDFGKMGAANNDAIRIFSEAGWK